MNNNQTKRCSACKNSLDITAFEESEAICRGCKAFEKAKKVNK